MARSGRQVIRLAFPVALLVGLLGGCAAPDGVSTPRLHDGISHQLLTPQPGQRIHLLRVDLQHPGLRLALSPPDQRGQPIDQMPSARQALLAINASFFDHDFQVRGLTVSDGQPWPGVLRPQDSPLLDCDRAQRCRLQLQPPLALADHSWTAVAGTPWLVRQGNVRTDADDATCPALCQRSHPRTAIALDRSGRWLLIALAEGRRDHVAGIALAPLARLMLQHGAHDALNLDGGGSSALLVRGVSLMARPANEPEQRRIANALLVLAR
jgi:exopolysaccharide biosynthesis protein